jgi:hypothetical protein
VSALHTPAAGNQELDPLGVDPEDRTASQLYHGSLTSRVSIPRVDRSALEQRLDAWLVPPGSPECSQCKLPGPCGWSLAQP